MGLWGGSVVSGVRGHACVCVFIHVKKICDKGKAWSPYMGLRERERGRERERC